MDRWMAWDEYMGRMWEWAMGAVGAGWARSTAVWRPDCAETCLVANLAALLPETINHIIIVAIINIIIILL